MMFFMSKYVETLSVDAKECYLKKTSLIGNTDPFTLGRKIIVPGVQAACSHKSSCHWTLSPGEFGPAGLKSPQRFWSGWINLLGNLVRSGELGPYCFVYAALSTAAAAAACCYSTVNDYELALPRNPSHSSRTRNEHLTADSATTTTTHATDS